jgi:transcriptional regulator with XRE-family HTH domain
VTPRLRQNEDVSGAGDLGAFLRARRAQVHPGDVGLPSGIGFRRTPGLRREELAALAGVSIEYYTRLEQGRETNPSAEVLNALASALLLDDHGHAYLFAVANRVAGRVLPRRPDPGRAVPPGIRLLLDTLRPFPAYLLSRTSDVLAANPEALLLFAGIEEWPEGRRNTIRYVFLHPRARTVLGDWPYAAQTAVANLRAVTADDPGAADVEALVAELGSEPEFVRLWDRHDVQPRRAQTKAFHHPAVGDLTLDHLVLRLDAGQRVAVYQAPPGSPDHDALTILSMTARTQPADPPPDGRARRQRW